MCLLTSGTEADGEIVWSRRPDAGVKSKRSRKLRGDDGGKRALARRGERV